MTATETLAEWAHGLKLEEVPAPVRRRALLHLLDGVGNALAAVRLKAAEPSNTVARELGGPAESHILGTATRVGAPAAALANGTLVHALDFDDTHAVGLVHATAAVLPAAFAVGERRGTSGAEVLRAVIAGYEIVCRIASGAPHGFHARGLHATHACGVFSAAAVAALLAGSTPAVITDAMGIAGSAAGGLLEFLNTGSSTKQLHAGTAALNGILAARLAGAGASGPSSVLEGDKGFYAALSARPASLNRVTTGLGEDWATLGIGIKPYPACQLLHATLDAVVAVLGDVPDPRRVVSVVADVHPDSSAVVCEPPGMKVAPRSTYAAKFSLPWSVAALLSDGTVDVSTYTPASVGRPGVAELAGRVQSRLTSAEGAAANAPGHVEIRLDDGRNLVGEVATSRGTAASPMSEEDIIAKFIANCGGVPGVARLAELVLSLDSSHSLDPVLDLAHLVVEERHP